MTSKLIDVERWMNSCILSASKNLGMTGFNPSVCALAVDDNNNLIDLAVTSHFGRPHAEANLIAQLKQKNIKEKSLTLFCSLEPCSHYGKTSPCAKEIIDCEMFKEVIVASVDKDERVNGKGIEMLRLAGIEVVTGVLSNLAEDALYKEFFFAKQNKMPFVTLKFAISIDGKIALSNGQSKWISNEKSRYYTNYLRSFYDGILVGRKTFETDNPKLDCRIGNLSQFSPKKFVLSRSKSLSLPKDFKLINETDIKSTLQKIYLQEVNSLLVEGGGSVFASFIKSGMFNKIVAIVCPIIIGGDGANCIDSLHLTNITNITSLKLVKTKQIENDILLEYENHSI